MTKAACRGGGTKAQDRKGKKEWSGSKVCRHERREIEKKPDKKKAKGRVREAKGGWAGKKAHRHARAG